MAICKSQNGESGNKIKGMWRMGARMKATWRMGMWRIKVEIAECRKLTLSAPGYFCMFMPQGGGRGREGAGAGGT